MSTTNPKLINTRIKNKVDSLDKWNSSTSKLLNGEIAIARIKTGEHYNPVTDANEPSWELLMKVGDGSKTFAELPWLSAKASDVYNWAKNSHAYDIPVGISDGTTYTEGTLGKYLQTYGKDISTNASNIAANTTAINQLLGTDSAGTSIQDRITEAIKALDHVDDSTTDVRDDYAIVKAVKQEDGIVTVTYGTITNDELPNNISASKITVSDGKQLHTKLNEVDASIANIDSILEGVNTDGITTVVGYVENEFGKLDLTADPTSSGEAEDTENFVTQVRQEDGKVSYSRKTLPVATTTKKGIALLGATGGAATYDSIFGSDGKGGINKTLTDATAQNASDIANIRSAIASGVHFRGTVTAKPTSAKVTINGSTELDAAAGDIVLWSAEGIEYIYTGSAWEELGDVTRLGDLETLVYSLHEETSTGNNFVTHITKNADGTFTVNKAQPTSANILHDGSTVKAALEGHDAKIATVEGKLEGVTLVTTSISEAINALDVDEPTASGTSTSFIATARQADGKIEVTKKNLPTASTTVQGIVKLNDTTSSTSTTEAATANAVKSAYDAGVDAQSRVAVVEGNYVKYNSTTKHVYIGKDGDTGDKATTEYIIFDCGNAEGWD